MLEALVVEGLLHYAYNGLEHPQFLVCAGGGGAGINSVGTEDHCEQVISSVVQIF